jgi:hypothetical protein
MTDNRKSGIAMVIHPHGAASAGPVTPEQVAHLVLTSGFAHSLALVSVLLLVLGAFGLTRRLAAADRLAFCGVVVYAFAAVAIMIAGAVSGFIVPGIMRHMVRDVASAAPQWHIAIDSIFQINQAFARIYSVAASVAVALWSAAALRNGGIGRGIAIYGCIVAPVLVVGICSGVLELNVHGMGLVALAQAIWFIGVGAQLCAMKAATGLASTP